MNNNPLVKAKVVVVGDAAVGKTSLSFRFTENSFYDSYRQTVGASFCCRSLDIDGKTVIFQLWDTAGQERFRSLVPMYLRDASVALLVYDISNKTSFNNIDIWMNQLQQYGPRNVMCTLIGNKKDLDETNLRNVTEEEGLLLAEKYNIQFSETSAKTGEGVDKVFQDIGTALVAHHSKTKRHSSVIINDHSFFQTQQRRKCCSNS